MLIFHHFTPGLAHPLCAFLLVDYFGDACGEIFGIVHRENASRYAIQNDFRYVIQSLPTTGVPLASACRPICGSPLMLERRNA